MIRNESMFQNLVKRRAGKKKEKIYILFFTIYFCLSLATSNFLMSFKEMREFKIQVIQNI